MRSLKKRTPAGGSAGAARDCLGGLSRSRSTLEACQAQILIAAHGVRPEWAAKGDLAFASRLLAAQAVTLDAIFSEMARRMAKNAGEFMGATKAYAGIADRRQGQ